MSARRPSGDVLETVERVDLPGLLVPATPEGAAELGRWYWNELERTTRGLVRSRADGAGMRIVLGWSLTMLSFGAPELRVADRDVECRYPIAGGFLAARPGGSLAVAQRAGSPPQLEVAVTGYHPRLAGTGRRFRRGLLYTALQAPLHRLVSRRFLAQTASRQR